MKCNTSESAPTVIFISKMLNMPSDNISDQEGHKQLIPSKNVKSNRYIGFARVLSGTIKRGDKIYIIHPTSNQQTSNYQPIQEVVLDYLYIMQAQSLYGTDKVPAGNIVAIGGLDEIVYRSATISSQIKCPSLSPIFMGEKGLLKVSVSAQNLEESPQLVAGLKILNKSDPSVIVYTESNGDMTMILYSNLKHFNSKIHNLLHIILATCGQVHLERCITDLEKHMCKIAIKQSDPIVSYRETIAYSYLIKVKNQNTLKKLQDKKDKEQDKIQQQKQQESDEEDEWDKIQYLKDSEMEFLDTEKIKEENDSRYGVLDMKLKNKMQNENSSQFYKNDREKNPKMLNYFNKGKTAANLNRVNIINLLNKPNLITQKIPNQKIEITVRALGFSFELAEWIEKQKETLRKIIVEHSKDNEEIEKFNKEFRQQIEEKITNKKLKHMIYNKMLCLGPNKIGPNILLWNDLKPEESFFARLQSKMEENLVQNEEFKADDDLNKIQSQNSLDQEKNSLSFKNKLTTNSQCYEKIRELYNIKPEEIRNSIVQGFEMSVIAGPLCEEPMMGACFIVESVNILEQQQQQISEKKIMEVQEEENAQQGDQKEAQSLKLIQEENKQEDVDDNLSPSKKIEDIQSDRKIEDSETINSKSTEKNTEIKKVQKDPYGPISGQIISTMKECCLESFLGASPRLVEGMYLCYIQCDNESYSRVWEVLNRRRARIIEEELQEGTNLFMIQSHLPIQESFDFYKELQTKTSGRISAQLIFDTWKIFDTDPFHIPQTIEEIEENGELPLPMNKARIEIDKIRKRKGIQLEEKLVTNAEKQNNLGKKK